VTVLGSTLKGVKTKIVEIKPIASLSSKIFASGID
jgi:hypothetical protein